MDDGFGPRYVKDIRPELIAQIIHSYLIAAICQIKAYTPCVIGDTLFAEIGSRFVELIAVDSDKRIVQCLQNRQGETSPASGNIYRVFHMADQCGDAAPVLVGHIIPSKVILSDRKSEGDKAVHVRDVVNTQIRTGTIKHIDIDSLNRQAHVGDSHICNPFIDPDNLIGPIEDFRPVLPAHIIRPDLVVHLR